MATRTKSYERTSVVGVFQDANEARRAVEELRRAGFEEKEIGLISHDAKERAHKTDIEGEETYAEEGAVAGALAGAGLGTAWAIGIAAGLLPGIGPVIAGGTLAAILASAGLAAAAGGLAGALVGMGIPEEESKYYQSEFESGRTLLVVRAGNRYDEAANILRRHGAHVQERSGELRQADFAASAAPSKMATTHARDTRAAESVTRGEGTMKLREEELHVEKRAVQTGEVEVHKEVVTEHKTVEVPVQREEVVIHRRPVSGHETSASDVGEQDIRIAVKEEQIHVEKTPVVKEEVTVGKRTVEEKETVGEDIRKERVRVERKGDVKVRGENERRDQ